MGDVAFPTYLVDIRNLDKSIFSSYALTCRLIKIYRIVGTGSSCYICSHLKDSFPWVHNAAEYIFVSQCSSQNCAPHREHSTENVLEFSTLADWLTSCRHDQSGGRTRYRSSWKSQARIFSFFLSTGRNRWRPLWNLQFISVVLAFQSTHPPTPRVTLQRWPRRPPLESIWAPPTLGKLNVYLL